MKPRNKKNSRRRRSRRSDANRRPAGFQLLEARRMLAGTPGPDGDSNDQICEATSISLGATSGLYTIDSPNDVDLFEFNATAGDFIGFDIDNATGSILDAEIRLFDSAGSLIDFDDDTDGPLPEVSGLESYLEFEFPSSGVYFLGVAHFSNNGYDINTGEGDSGSSNSTSIGSFTLTLTESPPRAETPSLNVTITDDFVDEFDNETSLREAVAFANSAASPGADTITFATSLTNQTVNIGVVEGQIEITESLTIDGLGQSQLTVNGFNSSRLFDVTLGAAEFNVEDITIQNVGTTSEDGGAIRGSSNTTITITRSSLTSNLGLQGGAIFAAGPVNIINSQITGNDAASAGGAIYSAAAELNSINIINSQITGNDSASAGGAIYSAAAELNLTNSTVSGNSAAASGGYSGVAYGGGIHAESGDVILTDSTVSGNSTGGSIANGGGISALFGALTLTNSTVSGNSTAGDGANGGGIHAGGTAEVSINNSIIAGNSTKTSDPDFSAPFGLGSPLTLESSIVGDTTGVPLVAGGNNQLNVDFTTVLETEVVRGVTVPALANNGGSVETIALLASSPAIDAGDNALALNANGNSLLSDQRGPNFGRIVSGTVDVGAFEVQPKFIGDLIVDSNGDAFNNDFSAGDLTLREAIAMANFRSGADTITFDATVVGSTIALAGGELRIADDLTIMGPDAGDLIIDAQAQSRVFRATDAVTNLTVESITISNGLTTGVGGGILFEAAGSTLTLNDSTVSANTGFSGGGIFSSGAVTLTNSSVTGNSTTGVSGRGGGIFSDGASLTLINSTVTGNTTIGSFAHGGGIFSGGYDAAGFNIAGDLTLINSTVSGNSTMASFASGGGISSRGTVLLANSTISGNTSGRGGGGIHTVYGLTLTNSTVARNTSGGDGGGIYVTGGSDVTLINSTISGNSTTGIFGDGGGIGFNPIPGGSAVTVRNSIIAGNSDNGTAPDFGANPSLVVQIQNSIIGDTTGTTLTAGNNNLLNVDFATVLETEVVGGVTVPLLTDNGGAVETIALVPGSPAINAGDNTLAVDADGNPLQTDQRGFNRITFGTVDIGAFEAFSVPSLLLGDVDLNGVVNFLDISPFIGVLSSNGFQAEADINLDGAVTFLDISPFIGLLSSQGSVASFQFFVAVSAPPEPSPLAVVGGSDVKDEDDSLNFSTAIPAGNNDSVATTLSDEKTDSRARQQRYYQSVHQAPSLSPAIPEPSLSTSPADLFDAQPELLEGPQDFELDEIFEGLLV